MDILHSQNLYFPTDERLVSEQIKCRDLLYEFNMTRPSDVERKAELMHRMLASCGEGSYIEQPFHANWGGHFLHLGKNVYINFNFSIVDDTHIYIDDETMIGPNVVIATGGHPICPELRGKEPFQFNLPVHIGKNCWIGAGSILVPGVSIGDNSVIGAGSVVTKDIPANVLALGVPCRVVREIGEHDRRYYRKDKTVDWDHVASVRPALDKTDGMEYNESI